MLELLEFFAAGCGCIGDVLIISLIARLFLFILYLPVWPIVYIFCKASGRPSPAPPWCVFEEKEPYEK